MLITDLFMPGGEGFETMARFKESYPRTKVIVIPGDSRRVHQMARESGETGAAVRRLRVLLVDDNADAVVGLAQILDLMGFDTRVATSGAAALREGAVFAPQVVLLDLGMPEMDGFETAALIREDDWGAAVKLVALTGWGQPEDIARTRAAGFAGHLVKPVKIDALLEILRK